MTVRRLSRPRSMALGVRNIQRLRPPVVAAFLALVGAARPVFAASYVFATIDVPGPAPRETQPTGINDTGQIVGVLNTFPGQQGFLKQGTTYTTFAVPGADRTVASGINDAGQIVGTFDVGPARHGFLKDGTSYTQLDVQGADQTYSRGINDASQIVGSFFIMG